MENSSAIGAVREFEGIDLGHKKRDRRVERVVAALAMKPDASFPEAMGSDAELEGLYRLFNNKNVSPSKVLKPHCSQTVERAKAKPEEVVVVAHDTTGLEFAGVGRRGLGPMLKSERGFYAHFSLAVNPDELHEPLGVVSFVPVVRKEKGTRKKRTAPLVQSDPEKEYLRWVKGIDEADAQFAGVKRIIHVADRESDSYEIITRVARSDNGFVLRLKYDRNIIVNDELAKLYEVLEQEQGVAEREVPLAFRKDHKSSGTLKVFPPREARLATLLFAAKQVRFKRPRDLPRDKYSDFMDVNVVRVWEPHPPEGEQPIEWKLVTREPVETPEQILRVVDYYRCRWPIEEFNKALKTGCRVEARQLVNVAALLNVVAVLVPIAWSILHLRTLANFAKPPSASAVLTPPQLAVLEAHPKTQARFQSADHLTARDALYAVAALGGHLKRNGAPGWLTLFRGYKTLTELVLGWELHQGREPHDV
jgi:hypothetical protein